MMMHRGWHHGITEGTFRGITYLVRGINHQDPPSMFKWTEQHTSHRSIRMSSHLGFREARETTLGRRSGRGFWS